MPLALVGLATVGLITAIAVVLQSGKGGNPADPLRPATAPAAADRSTAVAPAVSLTAMPVATPTAATAPAPSPQALRSAYQQARRPLLASPWWAADRMGDHTAMPAALAPVLQHAALAAQAGVPEAQFDLGLAQVYGRGVATSEPTGVETLFRWLATPGATGNADDKVRAITAVDHAMTSAIRRGDSAAWAAPLAALAAVNNPKVPAAFWQGLLQRCLLRPLNKAGATQALTLATQTPDAVPDASIYRDLAAKHLSCLSRDLPCGPGCN